LKSWSKCGAFESLGAKYLNEDVLFVFMKLTAIIKKGEKQYVALCPEVDVVSQGYTIEEALNNLKEAVALHIEVMGLPEGVSNEEAIITSIEVSNEASEIVR
jgi:predicted RNase H-like HicB family nuclease